MKLTEAQARAIEPLAAAISKIINEQGRVMIIDEDCELGLFHADGTVVFMMKPLEDTGDLEEDAKKLTNGQMNTEMCKFFLGDPSAAPLRRMVKDLMLMCGEALEQQSEAQAAAVASKAIMTAAGKGEKA